MKNEVKNFDGSPSDLENQTILDQNKLAVLQKRKKYFSFVLFTLAFCFILTGFQALVFYGKYSSQINDTNEKLFTLMLEKTRSEQLRSIQGQFRSIRTSLNGQGDISRRFETILEIMIEHFRTGPLDTIEQVQSELQATQQFIQEQLEQEPAEALMEINKNITQLGSDFEGLYDVYFIPYDQLHAELQNPPWYLWPTAGVLRDVSGYLNAVTLNRAIYLSQIGEIGTARVLLSGMYATSDDQVLLGLVYYSLGRLQWELFLNRLEPENYFQAVNYIRQSIQADPDSSLAKRLFDYMLSLTEAESTPGAGKGDPTTLTEGEAGAVQKPKPLF